MQALQAVVGEAFAPLTDCVAVSLMHPPSNQHAKVNQSNEPSNPASSQGKLRLQRIDEYRQEALTNPDALIANMGATNSDLMQIAFHLMKATNQALAQSANPFEDLPKILSVILFLGILPLSEV